MVKEVPKGEYISVQNCFFSLWEIYMEAWQIYYFWWTLSCLSLLPCHLWPSLGKYSLVNSTWNWTALTNMLPTAAITPWWSTSIRKNPQTNRSNNSQDLAYFALPVLPRISCLYARSYPIAFGSEIFTSALSVIKSFTCGLSVFRRWHPSVTIAEMSHAVPHNSFKDILIKEGSIVTDWQQVTCFLDGVENS